MTEFGSIQGVVITPLEVIKTDGGAVLRGLRETDSGFSGFGEAYFSEIDQCQIRAWKRHHDMTLNLVVVAGAIRFVLYDDRDATPEFMEVTLSRDEHYARLTVPPLLWIGFQGVNAGPNLLVNIASLPHSDDELERRPIDSFTFEW